MQSRKLKLQGFYLQPNIQEECYVLDFPTKWVKSYQDIKNFLGSDKKHIKFKPYEKFLLAHESSLLCVQSLDEAWQNSYWLIAKDKISTRRVYMYFIMSLKTVTKQLKDEEKKQLLSNWINSLQFEDLEQFYTQKFELTNEEGYISNSIAYKIYPRIVYQQIVNKPLLIEDNLYPFLFVEDGIITDPSLLKYKNNQYSLKIKAAIQTTPSKRKPMLLFTFHITRWMDYKVPTYSWNFSNTTVYKKDRGRLIRLEAEVKDKYFQWESLTQQFYDNVYDGEPLPDAHEVMANPRDFLDFYITHRLEFGKKGTSVGSGESMKDRNLLMRALTERLKSHIVEMPWIEGKTVKVQKMDKVAQRDLTNVEKHEDTFRVLANAIGQRQLNVEVYYTGEPKILKLVKEQLAAIFGAAEGTIETQHLVMNISYHLANEVFAALSNDKGEKVRHEEKIKEIDGLVTSANEVTACLMLIPYEDKEGNLFYTQKEDPKRAIRAAFAIKNRLTQFISTSLDDSDKERVKTAIYDLMRQLGYVDPFEEKKVKEASYNTAITALHVINKKYTPYGSTSRTIVTVTRLANRGPIMVECPALWKGAIRYWEACLKFQKMATSEGLRALKFTNMSSEIKHKVYSLHHVQEPHILLVESNGQTRGVWKMITDSNLSEAPRKNRYTLKQLWIDNIMDSLTIKDSSPLRIIRVRVNDEVPDYVTDLNDKGNYTSVSGIFEFNQVYYSITSRPKSYSKTYFAEVSKLQQSNVKEDLKLPNIVEIYPIHLNEGDNPDEWVSLIHNYRSGAHQYKDDIKKPLLLHLAAKLEEYIY